MKSFSLILLLFATLSLTLFSSCNKNEPGNNPDLKFDYGKNRFTLTIDGDEREFYVHVPSKYTHDQNAAVVIMLHGTSGDGEIFYNISGWKEVGDKEGILTVYLSSWRYCIDEDGEQKVTTKWNTPPDASFTFCPGMKPRDDIKFLQTMIADLQKRFKVDANRIYLAGFSAGGNMAAKCTIEMSDLLAAIVESAGSFKIDTVYTPNRKLPVLYQVGNEDYGPGNTGPAIPMAELDTLISTPDLSFKDGKFYLIANNHIRNLMLNSNYKLMGDTNTVYYAQYSSINNPNLEFRFALIKGLAHAYPNGINHWLNGAEANWEWMKGYRRM